MKIHQDVRYQTSLTLAGFSCSYYRKVRGGWVKWVFQLLQKI